MILTRPLKWKIGDFWNYRVIKMEKSWKKSRKFFWKRQKWKIFVQVSKNKIVISWWLLINRKKVGQLDPWSLRKPTKEAPDRRMLLREWSILTSKRCLNRLIIGPLWKKFKNAPVKIFGVFFYQSNSIFSQKRIPGISLRTSVTRRVKPGAKNNN